MKENEIPHANRIQRFGDVMPQLMGFLKCEKEYQKQRVFYFWEKIVGRYIAQHVRPVRMDFRTLYLSADAPAWANQLRYMERELIDKINAFVCAELVKEIRFGKPRREKRKNIVRENEEENSAAVGEPMPEEIKEAEEKSSVVGDDRLRVAVSGAFAQNLAQKRVREKTAWHACEKCGRLVPPRERYCEVCGRSLREKETEKIRLLLREKPWLRPYEVRNILGCTTEEAVSVRSALLREFASRVEYGDETSEAARRLVMLFSYVRLEALTKEIMERSLKKLRFDVLYSEEKMMKAKEIDRWQEAAAKRFASHRERKKQK